MPFPSNPANGATYTSGGKTYVYNSSKGNWSVASSGSGSVAGFITTTGGQTIGGTLTVTGNLTVANVVESTSGGVKFPDGTTQTTAATSGITTGKAIAMSIVFGG